MGSELQASAVVTPFRRVRGGEYGVFSAKALLAGLWLTAAAAEWAALRPVVPQEHVEPEVVLYTSWRLVCGVRVACMAPPAGEPRGAADRRHGLLFFVHGTFGRLHSSFAERSNRGLDSWIVICPPARLVPGRSSPVGGERAIPHRRLVVAEVVLTLVWMLFADIPRNLALVSADPDVASAIDRAISLLEFTASVCLAPSRCTVAQGDTPVRRASAPAAVERSPFSLLVGSSPPGGSLGGTITVSRIAYVGTVLVPVVFLRRRLAASIARRSNYCSSTSARWHRWLSRPGGAADRR